MTPEQEAVARLLASAHPRAIRVSTLMAVTSQPVYVVLNTLVLLRMAGMAQDCGFGVWRALDPPDKEEARRIPWLNSPRKWRHRVSHG
jgi:hypothetical protein